MAQTSYYKWKIGNAGAKITAKEINDIINNIYDVVLPNKGLSATKPSTVTQYAKTFASSIKSIYTNLPQRVKDNLPANFNNLYFGTNGLITAGKRIESSSILGFFQDIEDAIKTLYPIVDVIYANFSGVPDLDYFPGSGMPEVIRAGKIHVSGDPAPTEFSLTPEGSYLGTVDGSAYLVETGGFFKIRFEPHQGYSFTYTYTGPTADTETTSTLYWDAVYLDLTIWIYLN